jgi:hypothetical protein
MHYNIPQSDFIELEKLVWRMETFDNRTFIWVARAKSIVRLRLVVVYMIAMVIFGVRR